MKTQPTSPTGAAQSFDVHETFFSTTDSAGVITAGNQVFCRTSGYSLAEMIGQPHNLIRHPGMPRQVFRRLWQTIRAGQSFMGYVKNHARNGNHYWVFAVVVPIPQGYLSVRIKPTSPLLQKIEAVYARLAEREAEAIAAGASESHAADASANMLRTEITGLGFADYEAFSHHALNTEIKCRDAEIARRSLRLFPNALTVRGGESVDEHAPAFYAQTLTVYEGINRLFASLDEFIAVCRGIHARKDAVQTIAEDFRLNALNAHIAAHPLGADGVTLGTVAQILNGHGQSLARNAGTLAQSILQTTTAVADIASNLSAARIQIEMLLSFLAEISEGQHDRGAVHTLRHMTQDLQTGFTATVKRAFQAVETLQLRLPEVLGAKEQLRKDIIYLQVAQISGLTEVSRLRNAEGLHATFTGLRAQVENGRNELEQLDGIVDELKKLTGSTPPKMQLVRSAMEGMRTATVALAPAPAMPAIATPPAATRVLPRMRSQPASLAAPCVSTQRTA